jgi:hypothetical protein
MAFRPSECRCLNCQREIENETAGVNVAMNAQTIGMKPRRKAWGESCYLCMECAVSWAMGPPPEGALHASAYWMLRKLFQEDRDVFLEAWKDLQVPRALPAVHQGEVLSPPRSLRAAG